MQYEPDHQISSGRRAGSDGGRTRGFPALQPSLQSQEVYPASVVRAAGAQDAPTPGLSRHRRVAGGDAPSARRVGFEGHSALHDAAKGGQPSAGGSGRAAVAHDDGGAFPKKSRRPFEPVELAAADSTGMDTSRASRYFVRRRDACSKQPQDVSYCRFPKLEMVCDCRTHLILTAFCGVGPTPDVSSLRRLLFATLRRVGVQTLLADAGYDSESNHQFARDGCGVRSVMPATHGRPCKRAGATLRGAYRRLMQRVRDYRYGQRWQIETVVSMIKRNLGEHAAGRSDAARSKDTMLK